MALKISDMTPTTLLAGDEVEIHRPSAPTSNFRAPLELPTAAADPLDPIEDATAYPDVAGQRYAVPSDRRFNKHIFFTHAANKFVEFPASMSVDPASFGRFTAPPAHTIGLLRPPGGSINGSTAAGVIWTVPPTGTVEWLVRAPNTIELRGAIAGALLDAYKNTIGNYRQMVKRVTSSAQLTLDAINYPGGCTVIYTALGTSLVLPSRLAAGEIDVTEAIVFHHRGSSGTLTISTTGGVVPIGSSTIPSSRSATIEWDRDATTQFVTVRTTG